jgi:hypothetical protein
MFYKSSIVLSLFCSLGMGGFLLFLALGRIPPEIAPPILPSVGYTVLIADESYSDDAILKTLPPEIAHTVISESSQWVLLDDFGELQRVPLTEYNSRLESFDPRRDGYAQKLRSFFIQNGKRFLFVPHAAQTQILLDETLETLDESITAVTVPEFSTGSHRPQMVKPFVIYLALGSAAFLISLLISKNRLFLLCTYPLFASLSVSGAQGLLLGALLHTLSFMVLPIIQTYFASRRYKRRIRIAVKKQIVLYSAGLILYGLICIVSAFWLGFAALACLCVILCMVVWAESNRGKIHDHIRFTPVPITAFPFRKPAQLRFVIPFCIAVLLALLIPVLVPEPALLINKFDLISADTLVEQADYEAHAFFQSSFSLFPLGTALEERKEQLYKHYILESNGLIAASENSGITYDIPPFPLETLMDFLKDYQDIQVFKVPFRYTLHFVWVVLALVFLLLCCIPIKSRITKILGSMNFVPESSIFLNTQAASLLESEQEAKSNELHEHRSATHPVASL